MTLPDLPYLTRVEAIRRHVLGRPGFRPSLDTMPVAKRDQMQAAFRDADAMLERVTDHRRDVRDLRTTDDSKQVDEITARLFATMADGHAWTLCPHLHAQDTMPGITALAFRACLCVPCSQTFPFIAPPEDWDRCDLCGEHGIRVFWKLRMTLGPALVLGDICRACADAIGINTEKD